MSLTIFNFIIYNKERRKECEGFYFYRLPFTFNNKINQRRERRIELIHSFWMFVYNNVVGAKQKNKIVKLLLDFTPLQLKDRT